MGQFHFESERHPTGKDPLLVDRGRQAEQFSQESDQELHGRDSASLANATQGDPFTPLLPRRRCG